MKLNHNFCEGVHFTFLNRYVVAYDDLFQLLPARDLANMKDDSGATPLMRLYHHHPYQVSDLPLISPDQNLVRSRRSSLLKLTSGESLIDCIQSLIAFGQPLSVTWFSEYLYLFKHLYYQRPSLTFTPTAFPSGSPLPERCEEANFHHTLDSTNHFFQRVISFLASNTDIFWNLQADVRYVQDIRKKRFPRSVYPDYSDKDFIKMNLKPIPKNLTRKGIWRSSRAKSPNLGANSAPLPLVHLDSLFWFAILTGWRNHT